MKVLLVLAHPEPNSLSGSLHSTMCRELKDLGHEVKVSDLYAMQWKASVDRDDFPDLPEHARLKVGDASRKAFTSDTLTEDVKTEQAKLLWADAVIFTFPLWWFSVPAILKGWVDRVFAYGFAYGVGEHSQLRYGDRYGEGTFQGKRAMVIVNVGGRDSHYSPRGINGPIDDILFPIHHGMLYYPGFYVLPPIVVYSADRTDDKGFENLEAEIKTRMRTLATIEPIAFRQQNFGDYMIPSMTLKEGLESQGERGFALHVKN